MNKKQEKTANIQFSIVDTERKYAQLDYAESIYGSTTRTDDTKPVSWGADNTYPVMLFNLYSKSSTLKACLDSCVNYSLGDDIVVNESAAYWAEKVNRNGMTVRELLERLFLSYFVFNGLAAQVVYNRLGQVVEIFPLDYRRCRVNESGTKVFYARSWSKYGGKYDEYDAYDPSRFDPDHATQIFWYKSATLGNIYPLPMWNGALYDVMSELEASKFSLNTISNNFLAKHVIQFPESDVSDEQKKTIEEGIRQKFVGSDAPYSFMLWWRNSMDPESKMTIDKIEMDDNAEKYLAIRNSVRENIFISCRMTPLLAGLPNAANGFTSTEYGDSLKIFLKNVISPAQDVVLECLSKMTMTRDGFTIVPYTIEFGTE